MVALVIELGVRHGLVATGVQSQEGGRRVLQAPGADNPYKTFQILLKSELVQEVRASLTVTNRVRSGIQSPDGLR